MMNHVVDFFGFMLFSSLEYFGVYLLALSLFNVHPSDYKYDFIKIVLITTVISFILVKLDVYNYIPSFIISPAVLTIMIRFFVLNKLDRINKKLLYSIYVSICGIFAYALIQFGVIKLLMHYDVLSMSDLSNSFSAKSYITQSMTAIIASLIAGYLLYFKSGFGFIFKSGNYKLSTAILIFLLIIVSLLFQFFNLEETTSFNYMLVASVLCISAIVAYYLSYKQDNTEYQ